MTASKQDFEQYLTRYGVNDLDRYAGRLRELRADAALARQLGSTSPWRISASDGHSGQGSNRAALERFYNLLASAPFRYLFETQKLNSFRALVPRLLDAVGPHARVLDVGCHAGIVTNYLALERPHAHVVGLDLACDAVNLARRAARDFHLANVEYVCGDLLEVHWRQHFDVVIATSVLMDLTFGPLDDPATRGGGDDESASGDLSSLVALSDTEIDEIVEMTRRLTAKVHCLTRVAAAGGQIVVSLDFPEGDAAERRLADRHRSLICRALRAAGFDGDSEVKLSYSKYRDTLDSNTGGLLSEDVTTWLLVSSARDAAGQKRHRGR